MAEIIPISKNQPNKLVNVKGASVNLRIASRPWEYRLTKASPGNAGLG